MARYDRLTVLRIARLCVPVRRRRWRIGLAVCILSLAACKTAPIHAPVSPAETNSEEVTDEASKTLPPDLIKEMPIYPGARIEHVRKPTRMMREILFSTDAELSAIIAYYKEQLKKNSFEVSSTVIVRARKTWSCSFEKSGRPGSIMLYPSEQDKSRMTIAVMYELPAKKNDSFLEPEEDFDVLGPGEIVQPSPNPSEKGTHGEINGVNRRRERISDHGLFLRLAVDEAVWRVLLSASNSLMNRENTGKFVDFGL